MAKKNRKKASTMAWEARAEKFVTACANYENRSSIPGRSRYRIWAERKGVQIPPFVP